MSNHSVLVVDDQPHVIRVIRRALEKRGVEVTEARNGEAAFELLSSRYFDVLISDLEMPRLNGLALSQRVRAEIPESVSAIMLVTGKTDPELRRQADAIPATEFLEKPVSLRALNDRLDVHFAQVDATATQ